MIRSAFLLAVLSPFCCLSLGCSPKLSTSDVTGTVKLGDTPLEMVHVEFWPEAGPRSVGMTDKEGNFTLELDDRTQKGAVPGKHKVVMIDLLPGKDNYKKGREWVEVPNGIKPRISSSYNNGGTSKLTFDIKPGQKNHIDIVAEPARPR